MAIDLPKLAAQGRAYSAARAWEVEELNALVTLERERNIPRTIAANFIRNGILTLEDYDKAVKAAFVPKTLEEAAGDVESALKEHGTSIKATKGKKK